jgi:leucyl aminopeptidase (aminopeptidase T)
VIAGIWLWFTPIYVLVGALLVFLVFALLARVQGGKYVRPIMTRLAKIERIRRLMEKASRAQMERQNPALASAVAKLERAGALRDPQRAQKAMSQLTASERRAYMDAVAEQQDTTPQPLGRQERRRLERMQKRGRGR